MSGVETGERPVAGAVVRLTPPAQRGRVAAAWTALALAVGACGMLLAGLLLAAGWARTRGAWPAPGAAPLPRTLPLLSVAVCVGASVLWEAARQGLTGARATVL